MSAKPAQEKKAWWCRLLPDRITLGLILAVLLAVFLPAEGVVYRGFNQATDVAVALLFFLHGLKLSRQAAWEGLLHWKLHLVVLGFTFVFFPLLGVALKPVLVPLLGLPLYLGFLFLCITPSTVQSSIAFTSIAKGNVAAAVCAASLSSLVGIFLTPLLTGLLIFPQEGGGISLSWGAVGKIMYLLLLPFIVGQVLRPYWGSWMDRNKKYLSYVDQGSILLIVYTAFSHAMSSGIFGQFSWGVLGILVGVSFAVLVLVLFLSFVLPPRLGFGRADTIAIMFCGSKKSLASGIPMLNVLVAGQALGAFILPLMIFHQLQLMMCAFLAQRLRRNDVET